MLEHGDIEQTGASTCATRKSPATYWGVRFGGGSHTRLGSGGFAVWDKQVWLVIARGLWFGSAFPMNNQAEMASLVAALHWVVENSTGTCRAVHIEGDS